MPTPLLKGIEYQTLQFIWSQIRQASSEFSKDVLKQEEHPKPYIYLIGIEYQALQSIWPTTEYMYYITFSQPELFKLIKRRNCPSSEHWWHNSKNYIQSKRQIPPNEGDSQLLSINEITDEMGEIGNMTLSIEVTNGFKIIERAPTLKLLYK